MTRRGFLGRSVRYRYRLVAAMLVVSVPLMVVLATLLTKSASAGSHDGSRERGGNVARAVSLHVENWISERQEQLEADREAGFGSTRQACTARRLLQRRAEVRVTTGDRDDRPGWQRARLEHAEQQLQRSRASWFRSARSGKIGADVARPARLVGSSGSSPSPILGARRPSPGGRRGQPQHGAAGEPAQPGARRRHPGGRRSSHRGL